MITNINAASAYSNARSAIAPGADDGSSAIKHIGEAAEAFAQQVEQVDIAAKGAMTGTVETHQLVQTIAETKLAMETVVAIRDKVVEAYQEILRMPA